jgi:hypothetical protein
MRRRVEFENALLEALGLRDQRVRRLVLTIEYGCPPTVEAEVYVTGNQAMLTTVLKRFQFNVEEIEAPCQEVGDDATG